MIFSFKNIIKLLYDKYVLSPDTELTETESDARKYRDNKTENVIAMGNPARPMKKNVDNKVFK